METYLTCVLAVALLVASLAGCTAAEGAPEGGATIGNATFRLTVRASAGELSAELDDLRAGRRAADGPCVYRANLASQPDPAEPLTHAVVNVRGGTLEVRGKLAGLELEQTFTCAPGRPWMEERIVLRNRSAAAISLSALEIGLTKRLAAPGGAPVAELATDRWVAVPLRVRADDPKGAPEDYTAADLLTKPGWEPLLEVTGRRASRHRFSEGWAWLHGADALGIFHFSQENLQFSAITKHDAGEGAFLRIGGACMLADAPAALSRIAPGQSVDLGVTRYQSVAGGYEQAAYAFRDMLDARGCHFPKDYDPPIHWEQLYNMEGAWDDRANRYTLAAIEHEAALGVAYSCEALYLDPGWDTEFGTFLWGEKWLGPRRAFMREMREKYGLGVALHCPLATWMSQPGVSWGIHAIESWPKGALRADKPGAEAESLKVPALQGGRRNLALLPEAKAAAGSVYNGGKNPLHQIAHLNDGWLSNGASWIGGGAPTWAEIDLGGVHEIDEVWLTNDYAKQYLDRSSVDLRVLVATEYAADSSASVWREVAALHDDPLLGRHPLRFASVAARWVRVEILRCESVEPRLDEIEVIETHPVSAVEAAAFEASVKRGPEPPPASHLARVCLGSKQYRDEAVKRLLANCADGAVFLMFDGNWWNGGCFAPDHGHPVPYMHEDHIRANLDLAQRVHAKYPKVYIEMHDMIAGGSPHRPTPVYYKYGLPHSFDDNWGFELMWDPMSDLREGRAAALYYYNLGCNVPMYLHIDLRKDNRECVVLWWYASTCRHLGIGGTHVDPEVVRAQQSAMKQYKRLERFYKRGAFYGFGEQAHVHVLPAERAFVVNLFNLSDEERTITADIAMREIELPEGTRFASEAGWPATERGVLHLAVKLPPWSARVAEYHAGGSTP